jgi:hypothetical protein
MEWQQRLTKGRRRGSTQALPAGTAEVGRQFEQFKSSIASSCEISSLKVAETWLHSGVSRACIGKVDELDKLTGFENLAWLFTCDSRNRGIIRQGFDEAALLWEAVKATSGSILEIGRNVAGSTVLLAAAGPAREIYSIDIKSNVHPACAKFLSRSGAKGRVHLLVCDSRRSLPALEFGFLFIDGDHSLDGVLADVCAHWDALQTRTDCPALAAFHDALPNDNFKWRDANRRLHRVLIRLKNKFRKRQKPEIAPDYEPGVLRVCQSLIHLGLAARWDAAGSMCVLRKLADLPGDFSQQVRNARIAGIIEAFSLKESTSPD